MIERGPVQSVEGQRGAWVSTRPQIPRIAHLETIVVHGQGIR